ncbi:hypothetical protein Trydic_g9222 [Trypoxylus dichotomus]
MNIIVILLVLFTICDHDNMLRSDGLFIRDIGTNPIIELSLNICYVCSNLQIFLRRRGNLKDGIEPVENFFPVVLDLLCQSRENTKTIAASSSKILEKLDGELEKLTEKLEKQ